MTVRVLLESVFVLHHRPYRNSSLIVEFLSDNMAVLLRWRAALVDQNRVIEVIYNYFRHYWLRGVGSMSS